MIRHLSIRNFVIIESLDVSFGPGLTVLTGETGAGKSILVDALTAILGGRSGPDVVRSGAERATVDGVFDLSGAPALAEAAAMAGYPCEGGELLLSREIAAEGRSTCRINGRPAALSALRALAEELVDLHGQHEHQSLLSVPRHMDILDDWSGPERLKLRQEAAEAYRQVKDLEEERTALLRDERERAQLADLYRFQVREIASAALESGEEEQLAQECLRQANAQRLREAAHAAAAALREENLGVLDRLAEAVHVLRSASDTDPALAAPAAALESARYDLEEAARELARYSETLEVDPERLAQLEARLDLIRQLKRKYGDTVEQVLVYGAEAADRLEALEHHEERLAEIENALMRARQRLKELCGTLTTARQADAERFARAVCAELSDLGMEKTRFEVEVTAAEPGPRGSDRVEFLIAPNPGEPLRPLARTVSGGEVSRVMLAIKSAMARQDPLPTMVFDEIDVGVGGRTAFAVGSKLHRVSRSAQVLCITHLPQIAARGDWHLYIEKHVMGERTTVALRPLEGEERVREIARMLSGDKMTETALRHAEELLQTAEA
jgi:DNA repair protein RecN (Recombination protein N)